MEYDECHSCCMKDLLFLLLLLSFLFVCFPLLLFIICLLPR